MTVRIALYCRSYHDVVDAAFLREFPEVEAARADSLEAAARALAGAEILHVNDSFYTPDFARVVARHGGNLRWIQFTTVGTDHAAEAGLPDGVWITNAGGVRQKILAVHAIALMLGLMRGLQAYGPARAARDWGREALFPHLASPEGATMVIVGMGRLGREVARKARAFDMTVICVTRAGAPASPDIDRVVPRARLAEVLPGADVVVVAAPLDDETRHLIGARELAAMDPGAVLVNVSRGPVVDEDALAGALAAGRLRGAGLDAFGDEPLPPASPFWGLPNVLMTPHVGGAGDARQWERLRALVRENTRRYLAGEPLANVVREPAGGAPAPAATREEKP